MAEIESITSLLQRADRGDQSAQAQLFAVVEAELRAIARKRRQALPGGADVSTTMLVHDAFLHLVGTGAPGWGAGDRRKFFGFAARKMQDLLLQASRRQRARKRGGDRKRVAADACVDPAVADPSAATGFLLDLEEVLTRFEQFALQDAILFRMRYFLGCTFAELADIWDISETGAKEAWQRGCAWLQRELKGYRQESSR